LLKHGKKKGGEPLGNDGRKERLVLLKGEKDPMRGAFLEEKRVTELEFNLLMRAAGVSSGRLQPKEGQ